MKEKFSRFGWEVLEHLRRMATPFVLNLMFGMTMVAILAIGVRALEIVLTVLFFAGCCFAAFIYFRAAGEAAFSVLSRPSGRGASLRSLVSGRLAAFLRLAFFIQIPPNRPRRIFSRTMRAYYVRFEA